MRALTVWQPFASLIVGAPPSYDAEPTPPQKPVENRDWAAPRWLLGERIAIHAGKAMSGDVLESFYDIFKAKVFGEVRAPYAKPSLFPLGAVVGVATLDRVIGPLAPRLIYEDRFEDVPQATIDSWGLDADGLRWFVGRFGWVFRDRRHLREPVPCKGAQGIWSLTPEDAARVEEQLR
jgi:hypothetical protein